MTLKTYLTSDALTGRATITAIDPAKPSVRLSETLFHPQGGGQRDDRGRIGPARVLDTRHAEGGDVDHLVDTFEGLGVGRDVDIAVDEAHRREGARLHSAGHLLADAVQAIRPALRAVAGHHWKGEARVEFEGAVDVDPGFETDLTAKLGELIAARLPVEVVGDPFSSRALKIGDFAPVGCGGKHVKAPPSLRACASQASAPKRAACA